MDPVIVKVSVDEQRSVRGLIVGMEGLELEVSILKGPAERLDAAGKVIAGSEATLWFHNESLGETPPITSWIRRVMRFRQTHLYSVEVRDWHTLAQYWAHLLHRHN